MSITIRELAQLCDVSTATVSMVMNNRDRGRVGAQQREHVLRMAEQHGYRGNRAAKGLAEGRTYRIAIVTEGFLSEHGALGHITFYNRLGLLAKALSLHGYALEILQVDSLAQGAYMRDSLQHVSADGFVLLSWRSAAHAINLLSILKDKGVPSVACGTMLGDGPYRWADVDRAAAFQDGVRQLAQAGYQQIALLSFDSNIKFVRRSFHAKKQGFLKGVRAELDCNGSSWIFHRYPPSYDKVLRMVADVLQKMKDVRAFLLSDNSYAEAVLHALSEKGLQPGKDCRVIGFGDTTQADRCTPALSHYTLCIEEQVDFCVAALLEEMRGDPAALQLHRCCVPQFLLRGT